MIKARYEGLPSPATDIFPYGLRFRIVLEVDGDTQIVPFGYKAHLLFMSKSRKRHIHLSSFTEFLHPYVQQKITISPIFRLDERALNFIEKDRDGEKPIFMITLHLYRFEGKNLRNQKIESIENLKSLTITPINVRVPGDLEYYSIPVSEWIEILQELGYMEYKIIELPVEPHPEITKDPIEKLEEATKKYRNGDWSGVLASCEDALNRLSKSLEGNFMRKQLSEIIGEKKFNDILQLLQKTGLLQVKPEDLRKFAKKYKHEVAGKFAEKKDAEFMLHVTAALLRYLCRTFIK